MRSATAAKLAGVLDAQAQVITTAQIVSAGCDHELAAREVTAGRWQEPARAVHFAFGGDPSLLQRAWCGQLIGGEASVISGPLACHLLGIGDSPGMTAVVLVPTSCHRHGSPEYVVRRTSHLPPWRDMGGVRVASPTRCVVDASRAAPDLTAVRALVCAALRAKHMSYDDLLAACLAQPRPGLAMLRRALRDWADGARSAPEAEVADALREQVRRGAMPRFLLNPEVYAGAVLLGCPDVYVPGCALGGETDSLRHHGSSAALDATLTRDADFRHHGLLLEHVTPARFRRAPEAWATVFASKARERQGRGDPPGLRIKPVGPLQPVPGRRTDRRVEVRGPADARGLTRATSRKARGTTRA